MTTDNEQRETISLGLKRYQLKQLAILCGVNDRSRPALLGYLIEHAYHAYRMDNDERVTPPTYAED